MIQQCFISVSKIFHQCFKRVFKVFQKYFKVVCLSSQLPEHMEGLFKKKIDYYGTADSIEENTYLSKE